MNSTYGGRVNISRDDLDFGVLDQVVGDLKVQYDLEQDKPDE